MSELISREALQKIFVAECEGECRYCKHMKGDFNGCALFDAVPAVDAEPVRHSKWVEDPDRRNHWHCRECKNVWGIACRVMHYCPNCGAKMQGGTE